MRSGTFMGVFMAVATALFLGFITVEAAETWGETNRLMHDAMKHSAAADHSEFDRQLSDFMARQGAMERGETVTGPAEGTALDFRKPDQAKADAFYAQALKDYAAGDVDVTFWLDRVRKSYANQQKGEGRDEPEGEYVGCLLYQFDGPAAIKDVHLAHAAKVLAGEGYTERDAIDLSQHLTPSQRLTLTRAIYQWAYFAASCYKYTHSGYIVMPRE